MKGVLSRARSNPRGGGEAVVKEKEPFYVGPYRSKSASPGRKPRGNSENVPPDNNNGHVSLHSVTEGKIVVENSAAMLVWRKN